MTTTFYVRTTKHLAGLLDRKVIPRAMPACLIGVLVLPSRWEPVSIKRRFEQPKIACIWIPQFFRESELYSPSRAISPSGFATDHDSTVYSGCRVTKATLGRLQLKRKLTGLTVHPTLSSSKPALDHAAAGFPHGHVSPAPRERHTAIAVRCS